MTKPTGTNDKWSEVLETLPTTLKSHFKGSYAELGPDGLIVYLPAPQANIKAIQCQIEPWYIRPGVTSKFGRRVKINYQPTLEGMR